MATGNFYAKNANYIYALSNESAEFFETVDFSDSFDFHGIPVDADVNIFARPGYYEGANLDYEINFAGYKLSDYDSMDDLLYDMKDEYLDYVELNPGLAVIHWRTFCKRFERFADDVISRAESFCKEYCDMALVTAGVFSNGEAIYSVVK